MAATSPEKPVTTTKKIGMIHSSLSLAAQNTRQISISKQSRSISIPGVKKNATLENRSAGVNREILIWFIT